MDYSFTYNEVFSAFEDCLRHKKNTRGAIEFCIDKVTNLIKLTNEINSYTYEIGISQAFIITDPKVREVFAADFKDRIVHHLVINELEPYFLDYFIPDTFSCLKGRGVLHGVERLSQLLDERSNHYTEPYYIAKLDYQSFFMSIDKILLYESLDRFIVERYPENRKKACLRWLCKIIILHHPEYNCKKVGDISLWELLPPHKSLFNVGKNNGLAIGNLPSQMFANFYLTPFDHYVLEILGLDIVRYADDFVVGHHDLEYLKRCIPLMREYAQKALLLTIHPEKLYIQECKHGVTFIGAIIKRDRIYCGGRAISKMYDKVDNKYPLYNEKELTQFISSINSYLGLMSHYKSYKIRKKFILSHLNDWVSHIHIGVSYKKIVR